ncbi:MAG: hypothetical protein ACRC62_03130, partial [Microcoleus sp.]
MDLPKENPPIDDRFSGQSEDRSQRSVSGPDESDASAASQLEALVNLLAELNLVGGRKPQTKVAATDRSDAPVQAASLDGPKNLSAMFEEAAAPEILDRSDDIQTSVNSANLDNTDTVGAAPTPAIFDRSDDIQTSINSANLDNTDTVVAAPTPAIFDRPDEIQTSVNSANLDDTEAVVAAPIPAIFDRPDEIQTTINSANLDDTEAVAATPTPAIFDRPDRKTAANSTNIDDTDTFLDGLKSLLLHTEKLDRAELEQTNLSSPPIVDVVAVKETNLQDKLQPDSRSNLRETNNLDNQADLARSMPNLTQNLVEESKNNSQRAEILGEIKQDLNEADGAIETLQNLIFGSKISDIEQVKNLLAENDLPGVRHLLATID